MYFDSLTRKLVNFHQAEHFDGFKALQSGLMQVVSENVNGYMNSQSIFVDSHTMLLDREPDNLKPTFVRYKSLSPACVEAFEAFVAKLNATLGGNYRAILSLLVWMLPGEDVKRHFDSQKGHWMGRRFNLILHGQGLVYTLYNGNTPVPFHVASGDVFELNNRAPHAAQNRGTGITALLVIDMLEVSEPTVTELDRATHDKTLYKPTDTLPLCVWTHA